MKDNYLIEKVERDCPLCDKVHFVEKRKRIGEMLIKNEITSYEEVYFFCPESVDYEEDEFVSADLMDQNLQSARNAYRKNHGLLRIIWNEPGGFGHLTRMGRSYHHKV